MTLYSIKYNNENSRIRIADEIKLEQLIAKIAQKMEIAEEFINDLIIRYSLTGAPVKYKIKTDEDLEIFFDEINIDTIFITSSQEEEKSRDELLSTLSISSNGNSSCSTKVNAVKQKPKHAYMLGFTFKGMKNDNIFQFKRNVLHHQLIHELTNKELLKLLSTNKYIIGNAYNCIQLNWEEIESQENAKEKLNTLWDILQQNYGFINNVHKLTKRLKTFKQLNTDTRFYINKFKENLQKLKLEVQIRNVDCQLHTIPNELELAQILIKNSSLENRTFIINKALDIYHTAQIPIEQTLEIFKILIAREDTLQSYTDEQQIFQKNKNYSNNNNRKTFANNRRNKTTSKIQCKNGVNCDFFKKGICIFNHSENQRNDNYTNNNNNRKKHSNKCKYGAKCKFKNTCSYEHPNDKQINQMSSNISMDEYEIQMQELQNKMNQLQENCCSESDINGESENVESDSAIDENPRVIRALKYTEQNKVQLTHESGECLELKENVLTENLSREITHKLLVWNNNIIITAFIDCGADISVCGSKAYSRIEYYEQPAKNKICVYACDKKVGYKLNKRVLLPIKYSDFNIRKGKNKYIRKTIQIWRMDCLEENMIILGRDSMKILNMGIYNLGNLKRMLYFHNRHLCQNIMPDDEDINNYFKQIEYRYNGEPGIYKLNELKNKAIEIKTNTPKIINKINSLQEKHEDILNQITFGKMLSKKQITKIKERIISEKLINVFSTGKYDINVMYATPMKINIANESHCRILPAYKLSKTDTEILENEIKYFIDNKMAHYQRQSDTVKHSVPVFIVHRYMGNDKNGVKIVKSRMVANFKSLNDNTNRYYFNTTTIEELIIHLSKYQYFNSTDITKYFYQIPIHKESKQYCGISVPRGILIFDVVLQGLKNAPVYGHKLTSNLYKSTDVKTCQDDLFGGAATIKQTIEHFFGMIGIAHNNNLKLSPAKTYVCVYEVECVGYKINRNGLRPLPRNITKAFSIKFERLCTVRDFKIWCGMCEFLNKYLLNCAQDLKTLRKMMINHGVMKKIKDSGKDNKHKMQARLRSKLIKSENAKILFYNIQRKIESTPLLYHPDMRENAQPFLLKCDTSGVQIGASLWQLRGKHYLLIKLFSVVLSLPQQNYSATERECLGYCISMTKFEKYLKSRDFILIGDHEPLLKLFNINYNTKNKKLLRWSIRMSAFSFRFENHRGTSIALAMENYLSRLANPTENANKFIDGGIKVPVFDEIKKVFKITLNSINYDSKSMADEHSIKKIDASHIMQAYDTLNIHKIMKLTTNINYNANIISVEKIYESKANNNWLNEISIATISTLKKVYNKTMENGRRNDNQTYETPNEPMISCAVENNMLTRAKAQQNKLQITFKPRKSYIFDQREENVFMNTELSALEIVFKAQQKEYKEILNFVQTRNEKYEKFINFNNLDLFALVKKNEIGINDEGILLYKRTRIVVPSKLRVNIMHYYHTLPSNGHRGFQAMYPYFVKRFYWPGMDQDIKLYIKQCICNIAKYPHRKKIGVSDIGYESVYFVSAPNEIIFLDLYGPMEDGNYIVLMADAFDGYTVLVPLEPNFGLDAISIIKVIMLEWIYKLGLMKQIITDNGSNLVSKLNKLANYIFGIKSK